MCPLPLMIIQDYAIVDYKLLEKWMREESIKIAVRRLNPQSSITDMQVDEPGGSGLQNIATEGFLCPHGCLDYKKAPQMKCVTQVCLDISLSSGMAQGNI